MSKLIRTSWRCQAILQFRLIRETFFLSSSYESGLISALKELIMQSWSLTHKQHAITPHHKQGTRRAWWGGEAQGATPRRLEELGDTPSRHAGFPNSHALFPSRAHAHYALNLYPILSHFSEGWALFLYLSWGETSREPERRMQIFLGFKVVPARLYKVTANLLFTDLFPLL